MSESVQPQPGRPEPTEYDIVIIGAGSGNTLIGPEFDDCSVALIDDGEYFGGTCLNAGCIPTKMFVHVADLAWDSTHAESLGLHAQTTVDWPSVRDRVFGRTDAISTGGERYRAEDCPNVTLIRHSVHFEDAHTLVVDDGSRLRGRVVVVAAGSRPRALTADHVDDPAIHDSDSIMRLDALPSTMIIAGGGAVAVEFAHVFSSFGVEVSVVARSPRLLSGLDREISDRFTELAAGRWRLHAGHRIASVRREGAALAATLDDGTVLTAEVVLAAEGRIPNADRLNASIAFDVDADGLLAADDAQRVLAAGEPVPGVYALGDVSSPHQLKHVANHQARLVQHNILHPDALRRGDPGPVAAAVFGDPQVAHFGLTEAEAMRRHGQDAIVTVRQDYGGTAFGWALEDTESFCKLVVGVDEGTLLGAHIIGPQASILIQPLTQAAALGRSVHGLARAQYWPHPAATEVVENALLKAEDAIAAATASSRPSDRDEEN